jgi:hypothetical protein
LILRRQLVHWSYILEVLRGFACGQRWRDLVSFLLATSTSKVLLNGIPGRLLRHRRRLRQGDPLSPHLFILMMKPLHKFLQKATEVGLLSPLGLRTARTRSSFYVDDAALFLNNQSEGRLGSGRQTGRPRNLLSTFHVFCSSFRFRKNTPCW